MHETDFNVKFRKFSGGIVPGLPLCLWVTPPLTPRVDRINRLTTFRRVDRLGRIFDRFDRLAGLNCGQNNILFLSRQGGILKGGILSLLFCMYVQLQISQPGFTDRREIFGMAVRPDL